VALASMTGFGAGDAPLASGVLRVELRAVNHRHLDVRLRCPELPEVAPVVDGLLRASLVRGHIDAQLHFRAAETARSVNSARVREVYAALAALANELTPGQPLPLQAVLAVPGVVESAAPVDADQAKQAARAATQTAIAALIEMREREGAALGADLRERLSSLREHARWVEAQRPRVLQGYRDRLLARVERLLEGTDIAVDASRLAQEVAWLADRSDIAEELTRLDVHLGELADSLARGGVVGRKLDFIVQELGREVNTLGSKANDAAIAQRVVDMKAELERIREQVQNIL
jgi:uncharacterized protein (TIGR00255 family)